MNSINDIKNSIKPLDAQAIKLAKERQAKLAKPPGSLGKLEDISIQLAGISGKVKNSAEKCRIIVLCADNGVIEEGVSSAPRSVTMAQAVNMTKRLTGMSAMAKYFGNEVVVADLGIADDYDCPEILNRKLMPGTRNFYKEDAMDRETAEKAILIGYELAEDAKESGCDVIGVGEMGIGNTSSSSAVLSVLTGLSIEQVTGRGGGLTDQAFIHKKEVLEQSIASRKPDKDDVIDVLSKVGGLDIAAMCGVFLGAAAFRIPVVIDGFISVVAALCAARIAPLAKEYMLPSHESYEPGYAAAIKELGLQPWLALGMRLGEGSGCPIAFEVIKAACAAMNSMALFGEESVIDDGYLDEIRKGDSFTVEKGTI